MIIRERLFRSLKVSALRNLLIHEYDDVDLAVVWHTVRAELPGLISSLERMIGEEV